MGSDQQENKDTAVVSGDNRNAGHSKKGGCFGCCCKNESKKEQKTPKRSFGQKCNSCGRKFVAFLFSHIGLTCLVAGYSILGGYVFMKIEKPFEITQRSNVGKIRR